MHRHTVNKAFIRISHVPPGSSDKRLHWPGLGWDPGHSGVSGCRTPGGYDSEGGAAPASPLMYRSRTQAEWVDWLGVGDGRAAVISNRRWRASGGSVSSHLTHGSEQASFLAGTSCTVPSWKFSTRSGFVCRGLMVDVLGNLMMISFICSLCIIEKIRSGPCTVTTLDEPRYLQSHLLPVGVVLVKAHPWINLKATKPRSAWILIKTTTF